MSSDDRLTVLIVGGYGAFGGKIVSLLADEPRLTLIVAGRSADRARMFCEAARISAGAVLAPAAFDRAGPIEDGLAALRPDIVIDASGPFQAYGERPYALIESCLAGGANYMDLADGSEFVAGIKAFDERARAAGLYALSGASTCPALTAAAARRLCAGMARVTSIRAGIAPSPFAAIGENVVRAIAGYAGQPVRVRRGGQTATAYAFTEQMRFTISPPGVAPLPSKMFSLVDSPDLLALAELWPDIETVWVGAGTVPEITHRMLVGLAWLVRLGLIPSLSPLAKLMHRAMRVLRWGAHRGGMFVALSGEDGAGAPLERCWHMIAEGDDGPFIPAMAAAALIRKTLSGCPPAPGARAALRELELEDYDLFFRSRKIRAGIRAQGSH